MSTLKVRTSLLFLQPTTDELAEWDWWFNQPAREHDSSARTEVHVETITAYETPKSEAAPMRRAA